MFRNAAALVFAFGVSVIPARGADADVNAAATLTNAGSIALATNTDWSLPPVQIGASSSRGALLPTLYVSLAGLNIYDAYSTTAGLSRGASEGNPMMRAVAGNSAALWAMKSGATAVSIYLAERLWRQHHRAQAIAVMVVSNGMMAAVAARNAAVVRQVR